MVFHLDLFRPLVLEVGSLAIIIEQMLIGLVQQRVAVGCSCNYVQLGSMPGELAHVLGFFNFILEYRSCHNILYERRFISET